jgi:hypothetical protein
MEKERLEVREVGLDVSALAAGVQAQAPLLGTDRTASRMLPAFNFALFKEMS